MTANANNNKNDPDALYQGASHERTTVPARQSALLWIVLLALSLLGAALLSACGSSSGSEPTPLGGIDGGGFAKGTVRLLSSGTISVNGTSFSTGGATISVDGKPGTLADLRPGDIVTVAGTFGGGTGAATAVTFEDDVEGPVQAKNLARGTIEVLGQTVHVDGGTSFDEGTADCSLAALNTGTVIEVSGLRTANANLRATSIRCRAATSELEVTGAVRAHSANQRRFRIGGLTVDYSQAQLQNFPGGQPTNGQTVEARGTTLTANGSGSGNDSSTLLATRVEWRETRLPGGNGARVEVEGLVTRFASASDFDVAGQRVVAGAATRIRKCTLPLNLAPNTYVEVEGTVSGETLEATDLECRTASTLRISATIGSIDTAAGTVTALGVTIAIDSGTRMSDKSDARVSPLRLADLRVGDFIEVRGGPGATASSLVAAVFERDDPRTTAELRGTASAVAAPTLAVLGVPVTTNSATGFADEGDADITVAAFFAAAAGRPVKIRGTALNSGVLADEAELEEDVGAQD